jgi:predicted AAA+ superfamily ATPase
VRVVSTSSCGECPFAVLRDGSKQVTTRTLGCSGRRAGSADRTSFRAARVRRSFTGQKKTASEPMRTRIATSNIHDNLYQMFKRSISLPDGETFFLWGPRQAGKTTLLRERYPQAVWLDLLKADEYRRYITRPELLRGELATQPHVRQVVIDEVQKVPAILDEVHWLIENRAVHFALCGSSARKVSKGHANLLGGRAARYELFGLVSSELGKDMDLT